MDLDDRSHRAVFKLEVIQYLRPRYYDPYVAPIDDIYAQWDDLDRRDVRDVVTEMHEAPDCPLEYKRSSESLCITNRRHVDEYVDRIKTDTPYYD